MKSGFIREKWRKKANSSFRFGVGFKELLAEHVKKYGRPANMHAHLDRGYTFDERYFEHIGVDVAIGSDNNADIFVPTRTLDLYDETAFLANIVRFYNPGVWAKILTRTPLNEMDK